MKHNVGRRERYARLILGLAAGVAARRTGSRLGSVLLGTVAASGVGTAISRYCPLNALFGIGNGPDKVLSPEEIKTAVAQERRWLDENNAVSAVTGGPVEDLQGMPLVDELHEGTPPAHSEQKKTG